MPPIRARSRGIVPGRSRTPRLLRIPAADRLEIPLVELRADPFIAARTGTRCADMTQPACAIAGFVPDVVARATDFGLLAWVCSGRARP